MSIDLHTHTRFSDGQTSPAESAALAAAGGVRGLAVTDHDTMSGWEQAAQACRAHGLIFVPGIELSTEDNGGSVHLLGYWMDPDDRELDAECERLRTERSRRAREIIARLAELGVELSVQSVLARAGGAPVGRPHIAEALVEAGFVPDSQTAFDQFLADGGPAHVPKHALDPESGVRLLAAAGGAAVLAHPGLECRQAPLDTALLDRLVEAGLAGVEADHAGHEPEVSAAWRRLAAERELLVTGASDFHGGEKDVKIGDRTTSVATVEALRARAGTRSQPW